MRLDAQAWPDADLAGRIVLVPIGSVEQHGPHAPLGTDLMIARAIADRVEQEHTDVVVTPAIPIGVAAEHRAFDGSLFVSPDAFRAYLRDVVGSLASHDVAGVVFVNGHGGNVDALTELAQELTRTEVCHTVTFTWFEAIDLPQPMGHGGALETSIILAIAPEHIHTDRLDDAAAHGSERWGDWVGGTNLAVDVDEFSDNGVVGDPRDATAEMGEQLLDAAVDQVLAVVGALDDRQD